MSFSVSPRIQRSRSRIAAEQHEGLEFSHKRRLQLLDRGRGSYSDGIRDTIRFHYGSDRLADTVLNTPADLAPPSKS